jgi:predicted MFS family arabinose efflux permease
MAIGGPTGAQLLVSLNSSGMYLGIAVSGVLGAVVIRTAGVDRLPWAGACAALAGLVLVVLGYGSRAAGQERQDEPAQVLAND